MTQIKDGLERVGFPVQKAMLYSVAIESLRRHGSPRDALTAFTAEVRQSLALTNELVPYASVRDLAFEYLSERHNEMTGAAAHTPHDRHERPGPAPVARSEDEAAHGTDDRHKRVGPSPSEPEAEDEAAQDLTDRQGRTGPSPSAATTGWTPPPVPARRGAIVMRRVRAIIRPSIFDRKIRGELTLGKVRWSMIDRLINENVREAYLLKKIKEYAQVVEGDRDPTIEEVVPRDVVERIAAKIPPDTINAAIGAIADATA